MKQIFNELEKLLRKTVQARQDVKLTVAKLKASGKDYSPDYIKNQLDPQIVKAQSGLDALHLAGYEKATELLSELNNLVIAKHSKLNLDNPAWTNALKLIELSGADIDTETTRKINESFANDQSALRALRGVYKAKGVVYDGDLDKQIYDPESAFSNVQEWAYTSMMQEGSLNSFATAINKIAAFEGIEFPTMVDEAGFDRAMFSAAGIPDPAE